MSRPRRIAASSRFSRPFRPGCSPARGIPQSRTRAESSSGFRRFSATLLRSAAAVAPDVWRAVRFRALLGFAERLRRSEEGVDIARIALQLVHPKRFEVVEFFFLNQRIRIV